MSLHVLTIGSNGPAQNELVCNGHQLHLEDANLLVQDVRQTIQGTRGPLELGNQGGLGGGWLIWGDDSIIDDVWVGDYLVWLIWGDDDDDDDDAG